MSSQDAAVARHNGNGAPAAPSAPTMSAFIAQGAQFMQLAVDLADSDIIPKDFRKKPANCFLALEMAHRLSLGPMEVMQNLYVVHGTPSLSSKFLIGLANRSGRFKGGLRFDSTDDGATCYAIDRETNERLEVTVTRAQAERAGWTKNAKYREMGEQMLSYRAATFFVRRYCPEVMLGMMTVEEANELPRHVETEVYTDPLDAALAPLDAPDKTATEIQAQVHEPEAPQYAPAEAVAKLIAAFDELGVDERALTEKFGPLDQLDADTFAAARAWGQELKKRAEAPDLDEPSPVELFGQAQEDASYD